MVSQAPQWCVAQAALLTAVRADAALVRYEPGVGFNVVSWWNFTNGV